MAEGEKKPRVPDEYLAEYQAWLHSYLGPGAKIGRVSLPFKPANLTDASDPNIDYFKYWATTIKGLSKDEITSIQTGKVSDAITRYMTSVVAYLDTQGLDPRVIEQLMVAAEKEAVKKGVSSGKLTYSWLLDPSQVNAMKIKQATGYSASETASLINQLQGGNAITEADVLADPSYYFNLLRNRQQEATATRASLNSQAQTDFLTQQQASQQATEQREAKRWNTASGGATLQAMMSGQEPVNQNAEFKKWAETILGTLDSPLDARRRAQVQTELDKVRWTEQQTSGQRWDASFRQAQDNLKRAEALEKVAKARLDDPNDNLTYNTLMDMSRPKTPEELSIIAALQAVPQARANLLSVQMGGSPVTWKPSEKIQEIPSYYGESPYAINYGEDLTQPGTFTDWQGKEINPETPISAPTFEPEELVASPSFNWKDRLPWYAKENVAPLGFGRWNTMTDEEKMGLQQFNPSAISAMRNALPNPRQPTRWKPVRQRIG